MTTEPSSPMNQIPEFARGHQLGKLARRKNYIASEGDYEADTELVDNHTDAEVILSLTGETVEPVKENGWAEFVANADSGPQHRPIIDLDFPAALIPSSTPGHFHLYIDKPMSWNTYRRLLYALADVGIIEKGYRDASIAREFTSVRLPWVRKEPG